MTLLQPDEKVILEARRHWFSIAMEGVLFALSALAPFVLLPVIFTLAPDLDFILATPAYVYTIGFLLSGWLLSLWTIFFVVWTNYYLDILIVTDKQVIDIEQFNLFARDQVIMPLQNIQDIKIEVLGIIPTLLGFGDLHIQTASTAREVVLRGIRNPLEVKKVISTVYHAFASNNPTGVTNNLPSVSSQRTTGLKI